jgi:hypothetical protein
LRSAPLPRRALMLLSDRDRCCQRPAVPSGALAGPNDVLVSSTLRDLVIGSGLEFEDREAYELKGVPGEWSLFAVASP